MLLGIWDLKQPSFPSHYSFSRHIINGHILGAEKNPEPFILSMLLSCVLTEVVIGTSKFFELPCPASHLQQWQCQNLVKGKNTQYFPRYSAEHFISFLLRGLPHLLWFVYLVPLKSCLPMHLPSSQFSHNAVRDRWESYILSSRKRGWGKFYTHTPHSKPSKATHNEKSKLHIQSLEMPNTTLQSCRIQYLWPFTTRLGTPLYLFNSFPARILVCPRYKHWSDIFDQSWRGGKTKTRTSLYFPFVWKKIPSPPPISPLDKHFCIEKHNYSTTLHCKIKYSAELL